MSTEDILEFFSRLDSKFKEDFLASLTADDWQNATKAEWDAK
jgi:hypothetical protein